MEKIQYKFIYKRKINKNFILDTEISDKMLENLNLSLNLKSLKYDYTNREDIINSIKLLINENIINISALTEIVKKNKKLEKAIKILKTNDTIEIKNKFINDLEVQVNNEIDLEELIEVNSLDKKNEYKVYKIDNTTKKIINNKSKENLCMKESEMKRFRKKKSDVERKFNCNIDNCDRSYGFENSLYQHIKAKHVNFLNYVLKHNKSANIDILDINKNYNNLKLSDKNISNDEITYKETIQNKKQKNDSWVIFEEEYDSVDDKENLVDLS